jgi:hypothetical protein
MLGRKTIAERMSELTLGTGQPSSCLCLLDGNDKQPAVLRDRTLSTREQLAYLKWLKCLNIEDLHESLDLQGSRERERRRQENRKWGCQRHKTTDVRPATSAASSAAAREVDLEIPELTQLYPPGYSLHFNEITADFKQASTHTFVRAQSHSHSHKHPHTRSAVAERPAPQPPSKAKSRTRERRRDWGAGVGNMREFEAQQAKLRARRRMRASRSRTTIKHKSYSYPKPPAAAPQRRPIETTVLAQPPQSAEGTDMPTTLSKSSI